MPRETARIEKLLKLTRTNIALIRDELEEGHPFDHVYSDLLRHEQAFQSRLTELREHNDREAKKAPPEQVDQIESK